MTLADPRSLRIENALICCGGDAESEPFRGWVDVREGRIVAVARGRAPTAYAGRLLDGTDCALIPGLINTHAHSHSSLTRGSAEGLALEPWIAAIEREQRLLGDEDAHAGALATYGEALLSGTTTLLDMCLRPTPALEAARRIGIRAVVAPYVLDGRSFAPDLAMTQSLLQAGSARPSRESVWVGLHDLESCSDETIRLGAELAAQYGVGLHLHCAESRYAVERTLQRTGRSPVAQLESLGALGRRTVLAHGVWVDAADRVLLADHGTSIAHCPHANLKLASGFAPVPELQAAGVRVALATDGAKANNRLDMFDVMKFTSLIHKGTHLDASLMPARQVLRMATLDGADALGLDAGQIAVGRLADLVLVDLRGFHLQPALPESIVTNLVHAARGADVRTVIVDGELVVENGCLVHVDAADVRAAMRAAARRLLQTA